MMARALAAGAALCLTAGLAQQQAPTFRATADEVLIDVSVMDGRRPVQGLAAEDFVLVDNGVEQRLSAASLESGPIDVALVVQRAGNSAGLPPVVMPSLDAAVRAAAEDLRSLLIDGDHLDVLPAERGRGPAGALGDFPWTVFRSSILDELTAAMMLAPSGAGRRRLVVGVTGGVSDRSVVPESARLEVARRSDAVMHLVSLGDRRQTEAFGLGSTGVLTVFGRAALPLEPLSEASGGRTYRVSPNADITDVLGRAITEFRTRYLLRYTPTGVPREGWHDVEVRVTSGGYDVRHRRGYEIGR
jgi:hypothetical protein